MSTILAMFGSEAMRIFLKKTIVLVGAFAALAYILSMFVLPSIVLPDSLFNLLIGTELTPIFKGVDFFIPLPFVMSCVTLIMATRLFAFLWSFALWIFNAFLKALLQFD